MLEKIAASSDIRFTVEVAPIDELFSKEDEINIYRIVQECVNNILRHSQATEARVVVNRTGDVMQITVSDNGQGFSADERAQGRRGLGLTGIAERTKMLGGTYRMTSAPGQGTTVSVSISTDSRKGEARGDGNHLDHRG